VNVNRRFHEDQIGLAMHQLIIAIKRRSSAFVRPWHVTAECIEPDIRLMKEHMLIFQCFIAVIGFICVAAL